MNKVFYLFLVLPFLACTFVGCTSQPKAKPEVCYPQPGDTVVICSPSALPDTAAVNATERGLQDWGYVVVRAPHVADTLRTLDDCVEELLFALRHPTAKAIFCVRGGYGSSEVLDRIPLDTIAAHPKLLVGYSDIAALHSAWSTLGLPSLHASMCGIFMGQPQECVERERAMLQGEMQPYCLPSDSLNTLGTARGRLIGGNLSVLTCVIGTAYDCMRTDEPYILLLEDVGETWLTMHQFLTLLDHLGILERAQAIIYGEWVDTECDMDSYSGNSRGGYFQSPEDMIYRQIDHHDRPTVYRFPAGHGQVNMPLRLGLPVELTVERDSVRLKFL